MVYKAEELRDAYYLLRLIPRPKFEHKAAKEKEGTAEEKDEQKDEQKDEEKKEQKVEEVSGDEEGEESQTKSEDL